MIRCAPQCLRRENGLEAVVELARTKGSFPQVPESGPWAAVLAHDTRFAAQFVQQDVDRYLALVAVSCHSLFDRDTIPGAKPEELLALKESLVKLLRDLIVWTTDNCAITLLLQDGSGDASPTAFCNSSRIILHSSSGRGPSNSMIRRALA